MVRQSFKNKRVFITGHTGFKGSWFVHLLDSLGATIKGYALPALPASLFNIAQIGEICTHYEGDVRHKEHLEKELLDFQPDYVFHLAAQPLVLASYENPIYTFEVNQMGTVNLLDSLRKLKKPCVIIIITTDKVYKDQQWQKPYNENDLLGGYDPYSASKAACELIVDSYRSSFFNPENYGDHFKSIATARAGNVIGGGDFSENRLIPDVLKAISNDKEIIIRNPNAVRPWQHVLDALHSYLILADALSKAPNSVHLNSAFNFGPEIEDIISVRAIVDKVLQLYGRGAYKEEVKLSAPKETNTLILNTSKAKELLSLKPKWNIETALERTVQWHQSFVNGNFPIEDIMREQINSFQTC